MNKNILALFGKRAPARNESFPSTMMRLGTPSTVLRPLVHRNVAHARTIALSRHYATGLGKISSSPGGRRKSVTPFNDDGHVPWSELSAGEKAARATQQTFNFGFIVVGLGLTVGFCAPLLPSAPSNIPPGRHFLSFVYRSVCPGQQDCELQPGTRPHQAGCHVPGSAGRPEEDLGSRGGNIQQMAESPSDFVSPRPFISSAAAVD
jgi:hypothetical protein